MTVPVSNPPERLHTELTLVRFLFVVNCLFMDVPTTTSMSERFFTEPTVMWFFLEVNGYFMNVSGVTVSKPLVTKIAVM